jgi:beta-N-acetylhexosaminidase
MQDRTLEELLHTSLRRLIVGFPGVQLDDPGVRYALSAAEEGKIGGVILFKHNIQSREQILELTEAFHRRAFFTPFLVCIDQEGGKVERLSADNGVPAIPSAREMAGLSHDTIVEISRSQSAALRALGFNVNFAPCVDLDLGCAVIGGLGRAFGSSAQKVVPAASAYLEGQRIEKILGCLKHYPGHGSAIGDTHENLIDITASWKEAEEVPFRELLAQTPLPMVMLSHLLHTRIDSEYPSSLSYAWIDRLRSMSEHHFASVSDDFHMSSIQRYWSAPQVLSRSFCGGCDFIMFSNNPLAAKGLDFNSSPDFPQRLATQAIECLTELPKDAYGFLVDSLLRVDTLLANLA